jgi:hypothetical protein
MAEPMPTILTVRHNEVRPAYEQTVAGATLVKDPPVPITVPERQDEVGKVSTIMPSYEHSPPVPGTVLERQDEVRQVSMTIMPSSERTVAKPSSAKAAPVPLIETEQQNEVIQVRMII